MSDIVNFYNRRFLLELYDDWQNINEILNYIDINYRYYLRIKHDKDIWTKSDYEEKKEYCDSNNIKIGDNKKTHYHVVVKFSNPRYRQTIANELNIPIQFVIEPKKKVKLITNERYLLHLDNDDKHLYQFDELIGTQNAKYHLRQSMRNDLPIESRVLDIVNLIEKDNTYISTKEIVKKVCDIGLYNEFKSGWVFKQILEEHNTDTYLGLNQFKNNTDLPHILNEEETFNMIYEDYINNL